MKKIYFLALLSFFHFAVSAQSEFITTWKTNNPGISEDNQITIPTFPGETYDYSVDWGDGTSDLNVTGDITHTYASEGTFSISISGTFPRIYFLDHGDSEKIIAVNQWGDNLWKSMAFSFYGCSNMDILANDVPNLTNTTSLSSMFAGNVSLVYNSSINNWDTSSIINMEQMFSGATNFNQPVGNWDVSNVTNMGRMFQVAKSFNQDIGAWDVGNVIDMQSMFIHARSFDSDLSTWAVGKVENMSSMFWDTPFNQDISGWDTKSVRDMYGMFLDNVFFNGNLANWDVSNVHSMHYMFRGATSFNGEIGNWNVGNVVGMQGMFHGAISFNQDIGNWDIGNVNDLVDMFLDAGLDFENYDKTLIGWNNLPSLQNDVLLNMGNSQFCNGELARQSLIDNYGWIITDGGKVPYCNEDNDLDGVLDQHDLCLSTRPGVEVNNNGCDIVPSDGVKVYALTPSCTGGNDGSIEISMNETEYLLDITISGEGISNQFKNVASYEPFKIDQLPVGSYTVTITIPEILFQQTYGVAINGLTSVSGKRETLDLTARTVSYNVSGSKKYEVLVNGRLMNFTFEDLRDQTIFIDDLSGKTDVSIYGESDCQGQITDSFYIGDSIQVFPTISSDYIHLINNGNYFNVLIFSLEGKLIKVMDYQQQANILDISSLESGMYILKMRTENTEESIKIIKK